MACLFARCFALVCLFAGCVRADLTPTAPQYSTASIVNAATQLATGFAPYTIATVYGTNLSYTTRGITAADTSAGSMPEDMDGTEIYFAHVRVGLFYVSPTQVNFLIPYEILPGTYDLQVIRASVAGPVATIHLDPYAPGMFSYNGGTLIATHADGSLITAASPANLLEIIVIYTVGLGYTAPDQSSSRIPNHSANLEKSANPLQVTFDGTVADGTNILYAGVTPGCAGLYQINIRVPAGTGPSPSIQIRIGGISSPTATLAAVQQPSQ